MSISVGLFLSVCLFCIMSAQITRKMHGRISPNFFACCLFCTSGFAGEVMNSLNGFIARLASSINMRDRTHDKHILTVEMQPISSWFYQHDGCPSVRLSLCNVGGLWAHSATKSGNGPWHYRLMSWLSDHDRSIHSEFYSGRRGEWVAFGTRLFDSWTEVLERGWHGYTSQLFE